MRFDVVEAVGVEAPGSAEAARSYVNPAGLLRELGSRRMTNVLVEGGGEVFGSFFDAGLVDRVMVFVAPLIIGGADATTPVGGRGVPSVEEALRLKDPEVRKVGPDVLIEGWAKDTLEWVP